MSEVYYDYLFEDREVCSLVDNTHEFDELEKNCISFMDKNTRDDLLRPDLFTPDLGDYEVLDDNELFKCVEEFGEKQEQLLDFLYSVDKKALRKFVRSDFFDIWGFMDNSEDLLKASRIVRSCFPSRDLASKQAFCNKSMSPWGRFDFPLEGKTIVFLNFNRSFLGSYLYEDVKILDKKEIGQWRIMNCDNFVFCGGNGDGFGLEVSEEMLVVVRDILSEGKHNVVLQTLINKIPEPIKVSSYNKKYPHDDEVVVYYKIGVHEGFDRRAVLNAQQLANIERNICVLSNNLPPWEEHFSMGTPRAVKGFGSSLQVRCRPAHRDDFLASSGPVMSKSFRSRCLDPKPAIQYSLVLYMDIEMPVIFQDIAVPPGESEFLFFCLVESVKKKCGRVNFDPGIGWYGE